MEKLSKMIDASGYKEKVPAQLQEENATKLKSLEQEFSSLVIASEHVKAVSSSGTP